MKIVFIQVGKTDSGFVQEGADIYANRLKFYSPFEIITLPNLKKGNSIPFEQIKKQESDKIILEIKESDHIVLLHDTGKQFRSIEFADFIKNKMNTLSGRLVFIIGGAYGVDERIFERANQCLSLSKMTFSHQMVRMIFLEQLYRAFSILKNEPYHHE